MLALAASAAQPRLIQVGRPSPKIADLDEVRARSEAYLEMRRGLRAPAASAALSVRAATLLAEAQVVAGPPPGGWRRMLSCVSVSDEQRQRMALAQVKLETARLAVRQSLEQARSHFDVLESGFRAGASAETELSRLSAERARLETRATELDGAIAQVAGALSCRTGSLWEQVPGFWQWDRGLGALSGLDELHTRLSDWGQGRGPGVLSADLTYVQGRLQPGPLPTDSIIPAYMAADTSGSLLEDISQDREVELSPEVMAKAQQLGTAKAAYDFVKNELRLDWYYGSLKGATETLREGRGNDADLAALLVALLRAQGTPARFVEGIIELPVGRLADLLGLLGEEELKALYTPAPGAAPFELEAAKRDLALAALSGAGIPFEPIMSAGQVRAVRLSHVWVEAWLPVADYRGAGATRGGLQWMPLEPSIPGGPKYVATEPALDALTAMGVSAESLTQEYLLQGKGRTPLEFWRSRVDAWLAANRPELTYAHVLRKVEQRSEQLPLLPGSLPYRVVSVQGEYPFLPEARKHRLHITARDEAGTFLDVTLPMHLVVGRRSLFTYKPATETDDALIRDAGGLYSAPASVVQLLASVRVDGVERAVATRPVGLGVRHRWTLEMLLPDGSSRRVDNEIIAGNLVAIGLGGPYDRHVEPQSPPVSDLDGPASEFLYGRAADYVNAWTDAEESLARLTRVVPVRPTANLVLVGNQLEVQEAFGVRQRVVWKGLEVDADFRSLVPLELAQGRGAALLRLSGYEGSFQEAKVLSDGTGEEAVSAVTLVQEAHHRGVPVLRIDSDNVDIALGRLQAPPEVLSDVSDLVERGREVLIPEQPLVIRDWTGTGFIARDPQTEEGGYFLSGRLSGGQTAVSPLAWSDQKLVDWLQSPDAPRSTEDLSRIARIVKVPSTDLQEGTVGKPLPKKLEVYVTTSAGVPVSGAFVTFKSADLSQPKFLGDSGEPRATVTVRTLADGRAKVQAYPDTDINHLFIVEPGTPNEEQRGLNVVTAEVAGPSGAIPLLKPFHFTAKPGPLAHLKTNFTEYLSDVGVEIGNPLEVTASDSHGNVLANQTVTWTSDGSAARFFVPETGIVPRVQFLGSDPQQAATLTTTTPLFGQVAVGFIPGMESRTYTATAKATSELGTVSQSFLVHISGKDRTFAFRLATPDTAASNGIFGTSTPKPFSAEILKRVDNGWVRVTGHEPDILSAKVTMLVYEHDTNTRIDAQTVSPFTLGSGATAGLDGEDNAIFWPRYVVKGGRQRIVFYAEVVEKTESRSQFACCDTAYFTLFESGEPEVTTSRLPPDGAAQPLNECGQLAPDDKALQLRVNNPADFPLYVRLVEHPNVAGLQLLEVPPPDVLSRDPTDASRLRAFEYAATRFTFGLPASTASGVVDVELYAPDFQAGPDARVKVATHSVPLRREPSGAGLAAQRLQAKLILAVRNFAAARTAEDADSSAPVGTIKPIVRPARLSICINESGRLDVTSGGEPVASADVVVGEGRELTLTPVSATIPVPEKVEEAPGLLATLVMPGDPSGQQVVVTFDPLDPKSATTTSSIPLDTMIEDASAQPVGHTFVKDVSIVDGHLVKQAVDVAVAGRSPGLQLARSYTNRGHDASPLGRGWTHSYRSYVLPSFDQEANAVRYMVVGGEGTGQVFECKPDLSTCLVQRGFHGTFRSERVGTGAEARTLLVFRAKNGTEYRYGPAINPAEGPRHPLLSIRSPTGQEVTLEYGGEAVDSEVTRVYEPGRKRFLQFSYARPSGAPRALLARVDLYRNLSAPQPLPADGEPKHLGVCIAYRYNALGEVALVQRYEGQCPDNPAEAEPLREESFTYVESSNEVLQNNLATWTDANGHTTTYEYYQHGDPLPGEPDFLKFGDKPERVRWVKEPEEANTEFIYSLVQSDVQVFGRPLRAFVTEVKGPRADVSKSTRYYMGLDGTAAYVERPLSETLVARTSSRWDPVHMRRDAEQDARDRRTTFRYDDFGNLIERRTELVALPVSGDGEATQPVTDADGQVYPEAVEKWSYDPAFGVPVCTMDAEGRITVAEVDSNGADPRREPVTGTGLVLRTRLYAQRIPVSERRGSATCSELAGRLQTSAAEDIVQRQVYCGVNGGSCPSVALKGDLVESWVEGELNHTWITAYDAWGLPFVQVASVDDSRRVETRFIRDDRGRLERQEDTFGHVTVQRYDGLDRIKSIERLNDKAAEELPPSPPLVQTFTYYPGGQLKFETNGIAGFEREYELDGLNRVERVREREGGLTGELVTTYGYDEAGNRTRVTDRRGVTTRTKYDWGDRPIETSVSVAEGVLQYADQRGENGSPDEVVTATFGYDAVGNKAFETDLHGHRTEYVLDSLYRQVRIRSPYVPGASFDSAGPIQYVSTSSYDLTGNLTAQTDGNGHTTRMAYDSANRLVLTRDAEGREESWTYPRNQMVLEQRTGNIVHLRRTTEHDGLDRPLTVVEEYRHPNEDGSFSLRDRRTEMHYADAENTVTVKDARGFLTTTVKDDADRVIRVVVDDQSGVLTRTPDVSVGAALRLTTLRGYDGHGNLTDEVDPLGRKTEHEYDGLNRRRRTQYPMTGVEETFTYDGEGAVITRVDARGVQRHSSYDMFRRLVTDTVVENLSNGGAELALLTRTYDDLAALDGLTSVEEKDARGNVTLRYADALHREFRVVDAKGKAQATRYDAVNPRERRDRKNHVTRIWYDQVDRLVAQEDIEAGDGAKKYYQSILYEDALQRETHTDRRDIPLVKHKDALGRIVRTVRGVESLEQVEPLQQQEKTSYNALDQVVAITDANGHRKEWRYDGAGRKVAETLGADDATVAATTTYTYDAAGNRVEWKGPRATGVAYNERNSFDDLNRLVRREDALGNVWLTAYDEVGNKVCEKRPLGQPTLGHGQAAGMTLAQLQDAACTGDQVTKYAYDELGKLTEVADALGCRYTFVYDAARNLVAKQDANANLTTYEYDSRNLREAEHQHLDAHPRLDARSRGVVPVLEPGVTPEGDVGTLTWKWTYDANGNVETETDPKGQVTTSVHGLLDRLESRTFSSSSPREMPYVEAHSFEYDENGNLLFAHETKQTQSGRVLETTARTYDKLDRLATQTRYDDKLVSYAYDAKGNRREVKDSDGVTTTYTYDALERLKTATLAEGTTEYRYWPDGLLKGIVLPNGVREGRCYDAAGRLVEQRTARGPVNEDCGVAVTTPTLSRSVYGYDGNGNRRSLRESRTDLATKTLGSEEQTEYGYDALDRLTGTRTPEGRAVLYRLDKVGNRTGERDAPSGDVASLGPEAYATVPVSSLSRDVTYAFNRADWLRTSTDAKDPARNVAFGYDLDGNLVSKVKSGHQRRLAWDVRNTLTAVFDNNVEIGRYDYDVNLQRVKRQTATERVEYVIDDGFVLQELDGIQTGHPSKRRYHYGKGPLAVSDIQHVVASDGPAGTSTATHFLGTDALSSVTEAWSTTGQTAVSWKYDAWGNYRGGTAPAAGDFKLGYTGHQFDIETGLTYARARYYDSELGRFISRDSYAGALEDAPSLHRYRYARANPLTWIDPNGYRDASPSELVEMTQWKATIYAAKKDHEKSNVFIRGINSLPPKRGFARTIDILEANLKSRREAIARAEEGMPVVPGSFLVGEATFTTPDGTNFTVPEYPEWLSSKEAYFRRKYADGEVLRANPVMGSVSFGAASLAGADDETISEVIQSTALLAEILSPGAGGKGKAQARPLKGTPKPNRRSSASTPSVSKTVPTGAVIYVDPAENAIVGRTQKNSNSGNVIIPEGHLMSPRDPDFSTPRIVDVGPFTDAERDAFLRGTGTTSHLAPHHRHQIPVEYGGVIDELPGPGHPQGNQHTAGTPSRHPGKSLFHVMEGGATVRKAEIRQHWQEKGRRLVQVELGVWVDPEGQ